MVDINRMMRGSVAIYCEAPKAVADDISYMLRTGAEEIETLRARVARLEELVQRLLDNDPNEQICEGGITVLCAWRVDARRVLEEK